MRDRLLTLIRLGVTAALAVFVVSSVAFAPPPAEDRAQAIGDLIRCPVCAGEAISESPTQLARDMMSVVRTGVDAGLTNEQIIDSVISSYGADAQVLDPPFSATTVALWLIPAIVLAGGAGLMVARRSARTVERVDRVPPGTVAEDGA
jgi:cytochrome c-type biogenesis protein CcmH